MQGNREDGAKTFATFRARGKKGRQGEDFPYVQGQH